MLKGASVEVVKFATHACGLELKGRADFITTEMTGGDLKGCADLDTFAEDIATYRYVHQLAWYEALYGIPFRHLIAAEKHDPYRVAVWEVSGADIKRATAENDALIARIMASKVTDSWPCDPVEIQTYASVPG